MSAKKVPFAIVFFAVALVGCQHKTPVGPFEDPPGGPIIVLEPVPDRLGRVVAICKKFPCWHVECPNNASTEELPALAQRRDQLDGLPWRLGRSVGAADIKVTLITPPDPQRPENPINASMIEVQFESGPSLKIALPEKDTIPTWTLEPADVKKKPHKLNPRGLVYLPNWPGAVYRTIVGLNVTYKSNPQITIPLDPTNVPMIQIRYNRNLEDNYCE